MSAGMLVLAPFGMRTSGRMRVTMRVRDTMRIAVRMSVIACGCRGRMCVMFGGVVAPQRGEVKMEDVDVAAAARLGGHVGPDERNDGSDDEQKRIIDQRADDSPPLCMRRHF